MQNLKKLTEVDLDNLPDCAQVDFFTMRASVKRGVKNAIKPWEIAKELDEPSDNVLQVVYNEKVKNLTDDIMTVILNELYL